MKTNFITCRLFNCLEPTYKVTYGRSILQENNGQNCDTEELSNALRFFLNNQSDALIIQIYSVIKLHMFRASSLPITRSFPLYIRHW